MLDNIDRGGCLSRMHRRSHARFSWQVLFGDRAIPHCTAQIADHVVLRIECRYCVSTMHVHQEARHVFATWCMHSNLRRLRRILIETLGGPFNRVASLWLDSVCLFVCLRYANTGLVCSECDGVSLRATERNPPTKRLAW